MESVKLLENVSSTKAKRNNGPTYGPFNEKTHYWLLTVKILKKVENGGIADIDVMTQIVDTFKKYTKVNIIKQAYELDSAYQLHLHAICESKRLFNMDHFNKYIHKWQPITKEYYKHANPIYSEYHYNNCIKYLDKDDQTTVHQRYQTFIKETAYALPFFPLPEAEPEDLEEDLPYPVGAVDFID